MLRVLFRATSLYRLARGSSLQAQCQKSVRMVSIHSRRPVKMEVDEEEETDKPMASTSQAAAPQPLATPDDEYIPNIVRISLEELQKKADEADEIYESCVSCGRRCLDNRQAGKLGKCNTGMNAHVSSYFPHFGEEDCLRGRKGSGTIFFTNCNLKCIYCQNYDVSQPEGDVYHHEDAQIADMMIKLQNRGCHNINFVSPTHVVAPIMRAIVLAKKRGLRLPIVYNTGGYDSPETLAVMDGVVDIYMPDMKYSDKKLARKYSRIDNYPEVNRAAAKEMHRQVGQLVLDSKTGLAKRGLLVRHLVLPNDQAGSEDLAEWIATELGTDTYVNVMAQYRPEHKAIKHEKIGRGLTKKEFNSAVQAFVDRGITRLDHRYEAFQNCLLADKMAPLMQQDLEW